MSQEALYETSLYTMYKGKKLHIRFIEEYYDAVPRPIADERHLLKDSILEDGLTDEIKINNQGIVLDGHTRIEIGEEVSWKNPETDKPIIPKYLIKEFATKDEERDYVIKTNLMRRHLNTFQKVNLVAKLYKNNPHTVRELARYNILLELKKYKKPVKVEIIADELNRHRAHISKLLKSLVEDFCVRSEEAPAIGSRKPAFLYSILPKGEEVLSKGKPNKVTLELLGKSVGVRRDSLSRAIFLINHANGEMTKRLELGEIGIFRAYIQLTKDENSRVTSYSYLRRNTKVRCPHCDHVSLKKEWRIAND